MEYQIGFLEALNVMYITGNFFATALLIFFEIIPFIFSVFLYRIVASRIAKIFSIFLFFLFICLFLFIGLIPVCNSGWQIDGNTYHINAYLSSDDVQISGMEIGFVDFERRTRSASLKVSGNRYGVNQVQVLPDWEQDVIAWKMIKKHLFLIIITKENYCWFPLMISIT